MNRLARKLLVLLALCGWIAIMVILQPPDVIVFLASMTVGALGSILWNLS